MRGATMVEPWLRGTLGDVDAVRRQVLHSLEQTEEDVERWCAGLSDDQIHARLSGLAPVAFHLRHIVRSLDRLLTYAEGSSLSEAQLAELGQESVDGAPAAEVLAQFREGLEAARRRVMRFAKDSYEETRRVGRAMLPSSVGGLLVHCSEHTQRHAGQAVTTAKAVVFQARSAQL